MTLEPLENYGTAQEAEFILNSVIGKANAVAEIDTGETDEDGNPIMRPAQSGDVVTATESYFADDVAKVLRYVIDKSVVLVADKGVFYLDLSAVPFKQGTQNVSLAFTDTSISVTTKRP